MQGSETAARWRAVALLAAIVGAAASAYLLVEYVTGQPGVCLTGSGCDLVRASAFAYPLGIPTPLIGLAFYVLAGWATMRSLDRTPLAGLSPDAALLALAVVGAAASMLLTALEAFVIRAFCTWCLVQAGASLVFLAGSFGVVRDGPPEQDEPQSRGAQRRAARARNGERSSLTRTARFAAGVAALAVAALLGVGGLAGPAKGSFTGASLAPPGSPRLGRGAVEVVEFADFQCPGCAAVAPILAEIAGSDGMTLVYRYLPLTAIHPNADASARAAAAADRQDSFWPMSEALYARQAAWEKLPAAEAEAYFTALAGELGLDVSAWLADYGSSEVAAAVLTDRQAAEAMGLSGTPTLFIGGRRYDGSLRSDDIRAAIAEAISTATATP